MCDYIIVRATHVYMCKAFAIKHGIASASVYTLSNYQPAEICRKLCGTSKDKQLVLFNASKVNQLKNNHILSTVLPTLYTSFVKSLYMPSNFPS